MDVIDDELLDALHEWRRKDERARKAPGGPEPVGDGRRIRVMVSYEGDIVAQLEAAGMTPGLPLNQRVTVGLTVRDLERLAAVPGVRKISLIARHSPELDQTISEIQTPWKTDTSAWAGKGAGVIVCVIDTGIDVTHESFQTSDGKSRVLELWDQGATTGGDAPPTAGIGRLFKKAEHIDPGLASGTFPSIDDDGHGTHVAGIAAGNGRQDDRCSNPGTYVGVAPEADLIVVKAIGVEDSSVHDALVWCSQALSRHAGKKGVVINCSFGSKLGPRTGDYDDDRTINDILRPPAVPPDPAPALPTAVAIVCSAGNAGDDHAHEAGTVAANGGPTTLQFTISRADKDESSQVWIWYNDTASLDVEVEAPENDAHPGTRTTGRVSAPGNGSSPARIGLMDVTVSPSSGAYHGNLKRVRIKITPDDDLRNRPGTWTIRLWETAGVEARWDAWISGSAYFWVDGEDWSPPPDRRRQNTISNPGMSPEAITVANYMNGGSEISPSSSWGPVPVASTTAQLKPTLAAPGTGITAPRSIQSEEPTKSSCCDQKVIDLDGTSMATPHVTGVVALMFEKNNTLTFEDARDHLQASARNNNPALPQHVWGAGWLNAAAALTAVPAGSGGGGGGSIRLADEHGWEHRWEHGWGFTPHTIYSRLGVLQRRFGPRPGLMLAAALISRHVDEVLRLINRQRRVGAVWQRFGGPALVRHLLYRIQSPAEVLPEAVRGCDDVPLLLSRILPLLDRYGSDALRTDVAEYGRFMRDLPGADFDRVDQLAHRVVTP